MRETALRRRDTDLVHCFLEKLTVLADLDRIDIRANELHAVLVENSLLVKLDRQIETGLSADCRQQSVRPFFLNDRRRRLDRERLDIGSIRDLGIGHDRRGIGVNQYDLEALGHKRTTCLGPGVVEFTSLTDDNW